MIRENYVSEQPWQMRIPRNNGDKNLLDFIPYFENDRQREDYISQDTVTRSQSAYLWMYDQEPLYHSAVDIYRQSLLDVTESKNHSVISNLPLSAVAAVLGKSTNIPIWCHSELDSIQINDLQDMLFVPCYYWYHAFIAREWYRFWHRNLSLQPSDKSRSAHRFLLYARAVDGARTYRQRVLESLRPIQNHVLHDWSGQNPVDSSYSAKIDTTDARSAAIHLVAETVFDTEKIYLTEKVFKPMVMSQPFIVFGPPGTLATLQRYGFRTFDHCWSEAYDQETDADKRMQMLINLVFEIDSMPQEKFSEIYARCLPVIQHNRQWFFGQAFMDRCWHELDGNLSSALDLRHHLHAQHPGGQIFYAVDRFPELLAIPRVKSLLTEFLVRCPDDLSRSIRKEYAVISDL